MTKDEALSLALKALRFALQVGFDESSETQIKKRDKAWQQHHQAINAIKEALETKDEFVTWEQFYPDIGKPQIAFNAEVVGYVAPQRTWVGLTDDEIKEIVGPYGDAPIKGYTRKLFDQIEAKLKEKNT